MEHLGEDEYCSSCDVPARGARSSVGKKLGRALPEFHRIFQPGQFLFFLFFKFFFPSQLLSSISVIIPPTDSSYGNRDITADIAIHKNSGGWGPVARRAPLGKVIGQAAKGRESAEHVVLHPGDFTLLPLFSFSHAKLFFF